MAKPNELADALDVGKLRLSDVNDDIFASPNSKSENIQKDATISGTSSAQKQPGRLISRQDAEAARETQLQLELDRIREVNRVIEGVTVSLTKAKANMDNVHTTVNDASTLLATWTRILSQTEHNQRLILNPQWRGATQDLEDLENEDIRRQQETERRAAEEQRRRDEAQRKAEEEERRRAAAATAPATGRGHTRTRSVRGTTSSTRGYTGVGGQVGRGRGASSSTASRGTSNFGLNRTSSTRGRGRGLG